MISCQSLGKRWFFLQYKYIGDCFHSFTSYSLSSMTQTSMCFFLLVSLLTVGRCLYRKSSPLLRPSPWPGNKGGSVEQKQQQQR